MQNYLQIQFYFLQILMNLQRKIIFLNIMSPFIILYLYYRHHYIMLSLKKLISSRTLQFTYELSTVHTDNLLNKICMK